MAKKPTSGPASNAPPESISGQDAAFLTTLLGNLPGMAYRMLNQPDWPAEFISEGSLALTGYAPAALLAGGERAFGDLIHPDDRERVWGEIQAALDARQPFQSTYRIETADETLKWVLDQGSGIYDDAGNLQTLSGFIIDITDKKQAEEREQRAFTLFATGPVMIFRWQNAPGWPVEYVSPNIADILGYPAEKLISGEIPYASIIHPDDLAKTADEVAAYSAAGMESFSQEYRLLTATGEARWLYDQTRIVRDAQGNITHYDGYMQDVTERKATEIALQESEIRYRAQFEGANDAVFVFQNNRFIDCNQRALDMFGCTREQIIGQQPDIISPSKQPDGQSSQVKSLKKIEQALVGEPQTFEWAHCRYDGTLFDAEVSLNRVDVGDEIYILGIVRDITERKAAAAERERFTARLNVASEIAAQVQAILDPDALLQAVIPLIKERFGLYYVHVYTVDEAAGELKLRAGYGEPGRIMVEQGHSIPLDREASLVATAARTQAPVLVQDVTVNPDFLPNPLLPNTKSEVAVPAIAGGKVLGVFDVQHDEVNYFTDADLDVFQTLAGQIAGAFQNAELFAAQQKIEKDLEASRGNLRTIFDSVHDAIFLHELDGTIVDVNQQMLDLYEVSREEAPKFSIAEDYSAPENPLDQLAQTWETVVAGKTVVFEWKARRPHTGVVFDTQVVLRRISLEDRDIILANIRDITERKQAEAEIHAQQERLQGIATNIPGVVYQFYALPTGEFGLTYVSERALSVFELEDNTETFFPQFASRVHPDDQASFMASIQNVVTTGKPWSYEGRFIKLSGEIMWFNGAATPVQAPDRIFFNGILLDITEQKRAEQEIQAAAAQQQTILETTPVGIAITRVPDNVVLYVNSEFKAILGYTEEAVLHKAVPDFYYSEADSHKAFELMMAQNGVLENYEVYAKRADGTPLWLSLSLKPITYNNQPASLAAFVDITKRRQSEESLRGSEERFRDIATNVIGWIWETDAQGRYTYCSEKSEAVLGYTSEEMLGKTPFDFMLPAEAERIAPQFGEIVANKGRIVDLENWNRRKDGTEICLLTNGVPLLDDEGNLIGFRGVDTDITEQKRAEQEIQAAAAQQQTILETTPVGIAITRVPDNVVLYVNSEFNAILGYTEEAVLHKAVPDFYYSEADSHKAFELMMAQNGVLENYEVYAKRADGTPLWLSLSLKPITYNNQPASLAAFVDVTERKAAEAAILQEKTTSDTIINSLPTTFYLYELGGGLVRWNQRYAQAMGYSPEELVNLTVIDGIAEEDRALVGERMTEVFTSGYSQTEARILTKDGEKIPYLLTGTRLDIGDTTYLLGSGIDLSELKKAEIERESFAARLSVASEIAGQVQSILDPDELLQAVIPLIKERFGLYYVHVYTVDEAAGELKLRAGYGEPGRIMVERGHSIPLDREASLVATAARTKEPVLVQDVTANPNFLPNPLLPDTKSEVAVPAIAGGKVLGVFDVQHDEAGYFTQADLDIFIAMAGQIATAFQNAELYVQAERQRVLYDGILTNLPTAVFAVDSQFNLLVTNEAAQQLLGRQMTDKEGNVYVEQYDVVYYDTGERFPEGELPLVKANTQGGQHSNNVMAVRHADGTLVPILVNAGPLLDPSGKQMGAVVTFTDMTAQRTAQAAVERARVLYDGILTNLPTAVFAVDSQFNLLVTNEAAQKLLGQQMTDKEGNVYVEQYDVVYYDTGERFPEGELPLVKANTQGGQHSNDVMAVRHADGTLVPILVNAGPLLDPAGKQMGAVVTFTDMTEQRKAQDEALAQAERSRALLETIPDMMFFFDQEGTFLDFKAEAGQELYVKPEFFLGRKINEVLPPSIANPTLENLRKALETGELCSYIYQAPVGETLHTYEARLGRVSPTTALGLVRDITERQHAQAERERFAAQLGTAAEIARQVGTILDTDTLLNTVIPLLKERFGLYHAQVYVREEATGDLVLRAGYGAVGQIMLEQGHRITSDQEQSLVHRAATTKDVVLANDVLQEADFMPNLLLPETRAEVAVPALIGDQVVGVFDVQSDQINFFTDADLDVYRTLAGQIASAFQTARLFEQQKESQQALQVAAEKTRAIFEAMTEGLVVTGMMGKIEDLNDATLQLHGFATREEVIGRSAMQLFERAYWSRAAETMRHAMEVGRSELAEYQMVRSDHSTFEAEMNAALLRDANGKPAGFVNIVRDITDRKRAEAERARFAAELRTAADISSQVTSILDPRVLLDRVVTLMKEQFNLYHVHIYTLDSTNESLLLTASYGETGRVLVEQAAPIPLGALDSLAARAVRNKEIVVIEDLTESADHLPHPLLPEARSQVAVPAMFGDKVLGAFEVLHNQPHYFTQADLDVFRTLSGQVAASFQNARYFEEIQQAAERLREMDVLKSEFLANMSHELRTPLNSIIGYSEVMLMGIDSGLDEETLADVQAIYDNGHHLLHLINDVLDLAKIEAGHMVLDKEDVGVAALLEDVQAHNTGLLVNKPIKFVIEASEDLPAVFADRIRLNQILNNLVSNAVKFTEQGDITLRAFQEGDWICIDVEDTGVGIAQEHLDLIFERFRQVDGSNARAAEGTGLGLSITQHLVEMHHGTMHVRSQLGKGSTFTVKLPLHPPADEEKFKFSTV